MNIQVDFIPSEMTSNATFEEKLDLIMERVKKNIIIVMEEGLDPQEEARLIKETMNEIDSKNFFGIEFFRMDHQDKGVLARLSKYMPGGRLDTIASYFSGKKSGKLGKYLNRKKSGIMIVGPTRIVEAFKKESEYISMFARVGE